MDPISKALVSTNGNTPPKASWFIFFKNSASSLGTALATDSVNLYIAGSLDNTSSFLVKLTADGIPIWQKKLDGAGVESAYGAVVDGSGNIIIGGTTTSAGAGGTDGFSCIYNSSGSLIANTTKVLGGTNSDDFYSGLVLGLSNTYYLAGSTILNTRQAGLIAKYDATSALVWQSTLSSATVSIDTNDIAIDTTSNDIYIGGVAQGVKILIAKYNSSGVIQWQRELDGDQINYATGIVIASGTGVYTACRVSSDVVNKYDVALVKHNNLGTLQWQKTLRFTASTQSVTKAVVATDQTFVYVAVDTGGGPLIYKVDANGVLQWVNKIDFLRNASLIMTVDDILYDNNALYITGSFLNNTPYVAKLPSDGTGAGSYGELGYGPYGSYSWFDSGLTETTPTYTSATGTLTDAAATLTESNATFLPEVSYAPYKSWIKRYGGSGDVIFGIEVETSDAPFIRVVGGFTNGTNPRGLRDIYYADLNLQGQIITNRRSGSTADTVIGYALTITNKDTSDFIVVGSTTTSGQGAGDIYIQEVNNSLLSSISIRLLGETAHTDVPTDVANLNIVASTFYVSGKRITSGTVSGAKVICLLNATTVSWQRIIGVGTVTSAEGVALAESGSNVYVSGYTTNGIAGQTATHLFLAKYNSSGAIQWQRSLSTGTTNDVFGSKVTVDSLENVYVTGSVRVGASNTDPDILVVKYNSSGTIQWQRRLGSVGGNQFGVGIDTDSSNNVYIAGYGPNGISSLDCIILAKYNSSGTLQWQRSISSGIASSNMAVTDLKAHADGYIYVVGRMYTTGNSENQGTFIARLPQDGTNTGIYGDLEYITTTLTDAATTLTSAASTLTDAADSMTMTSPAGFTQADTSITIGPGAGK
jgi:uncharacterized protein (DUF2147 family)